MHPKRFCCCPGESLEVARYVEVVPVISIPASSYMYDNVKFFLDLREDLELNDDLLLYEGGPAATGGAFVRLGFLDVFVPDKMSVTYADGIASTGNLDNINALRHRGWKIKSNGLRFTNFEWETGDFSDMTRVEMTPPGTAGSLEDPVSQVDEGGFYFLAGEFSQTPALLTEKTTVDQNGDAVNYFIGYNPRRECSKPEQARTYNSNSERLLFDFTTVFPPTITLTFRYRYRYTSSSPFQEQVITRTYQKFVAGSATFQTTELLERSDGLGNYRNVDGYVTEEAIDSDYILFGYRAIDCTEERTESDGDLVYISAPSMPIKYYSFGKRDIFQHVGGVIKFATGDGGQGLANVFTDEDFNQFQDANNFIPHQTRFGAVTSDLTYGPDCPTLEEDTKLQTFFGTGSVPFGTRNPPLVSPIIGYSCMSYKGQTELQSIHTLSLETGYGQGASFFLFPRLRRDGDGVPGSGNPSNITLVNVVNDDWGWGTIDMPIIHLDSKTGAVGLRSLTNPLGGAYHYLTDGLTSGSFFSLPMLIPDVSQG